MNDFTKDELLLIMHDLGFLDDETKTCYKHASSEFILNLQNKIRYMVNNYDTKAIEVWQCEKCGHVQ